MPNQPGQHPTPDTLTDIPALITAYYNLHPDPASPAQKVSFGTSGHRGSAFSSSFNDDHIAAISQAICDYRQANGIAGPLFLAKDTHALSDPAFSTALEVLAANGLSLMVDSDAQLHADPGPLARHPDLEC